MSGGGRVRVLGVGVDHLSVEGLHAEVARLARRRGGIVLNVNAHCLNLCHGDEGLRHFFAGADVVFCDGGGVRLAARMLGGGFQRGSPTPTGSRASPPSPRSGGSTSSSWVPAPAWPGRPRGGSGGPTPA